MISSPPSRRHGLGQILDVVPNHMGVMGADNAWWLDVLENGPASTWGGFFDIDWEPLNPELRGKVLLPLLGDHYGTVLERGELELDFDCRAWRIQPVLLPAPAAGGPGDLPAHHRPPG